MDFFEALHLRAIDEWGLRSENEAKKYSMSPQGGVLATIKALKEMMVGEPIKGQGGPQSGDSVGRYTMIIIPRKTSIRSSDSFPLPGHHGLAGEEVVVMVFKGMNEQDK